jgi:Holliday junction resolvasome RuvABC endonuclease subunit
VGTIKKFMTGKGNATKEEMIAAAKLRGFDPKTDDEADALGILFLALKTNG